MKWVRTILLLLCFVLQSTSALAESVQHCCPMADCPISQCLDMGCAPPQLEPAIQHQLAGLSAPAVLTMDAAPALAFQLPSITVRPWVPPD